MATLSRELWQVYHNSLTAQAQNASKYTQRVLITYINNHPSASVADIRNFAIRTLETVCQAFGEATSASAALLYDLTIDDLGLQLPSAEIINTMASEQADKIARYQATKLVADNTEAFVKQIANAARDSVMWTGNSTIIENANRESDKKAGIKFARVISGSETCTFCVMLASQGFVYQTREQALFKKDGISRYHHGCRCGVIPGLENSEIEGFDFQRAYDRYWELKEIDELKGVDKQTKKEMKLKLAKENPLWESKDLKKAATKQSELINTDALSEKARFRKAQEIKRTFGHQHWSTIMRYQKQDLPKLGKYILPDSPELEEAKKGFLTYPEAIQNAYKRLQKIYDQRGEYKRK